MERKRLAFGFMVVFMGGVLTLVAIGYAMPRERTIVEKRTIVAPAAKIQAKLTDLNTWPRWSAWSKERDPSATWEITGEVGAVGHTWDWRGHQLGDGKLVLTEVRADDGGIAYDLTFADAPPSAGSVSLSPGDGGTAVVWTNSLDMGSHPFMRLIGPFVESMIGADFRDSLEGLADAVD